MHHLFLGLLFVVTCLPNLVIAQEQLVPDERWAMTLYTENDSSYYVPGSTADRYYTHGTKLVLTHQPAFADKLAQQLGNILPIGNNEPVDSAVGYVFGHNLYSPDNISNTTANPNDRPYAGWLYGGMFLQRSVNDQELDHLELNMGVVGPAALGEPIQKFVHSFTDSPEPKGWDDQLHDEFGINFIYKHKWKFTLAGDARDGFGLQTIPQAGFTVGNMNRDLNAAATFRAGWNLPSDFGPGRLDDVLSATGNPYAKDLSLYGFVRVGGKYVEHDVFVSGNNDHDSLGVAEEHWVGELEYGIAMAYKRLMIHWSNRHITEEFEQQERSHIVGVWMVSWSQPF
ncbi:MAG: lipid A deacylase LpxR family protein [Phycisphaeraceae bacterium JB051]